MHENRFLRLALLGQKEAGQYQVERVCPTMQGGANIFRAYLLFHKASSTYFLSRADFFRFPYARTIMDQQHHTAFPLRATVKTLNFRFLIRVYNLFIKKHAGAIDTPCTKVNNGPMWQYQIIYINQHLYYTTDNSACQLKKQNWNRDFLYGLYNGNQASQQGLFSYIYISGAGSAAAYTSSNENGGRCYKWKRALMVGLVKLLTSQKRRQN